MADSSREALAARVGTTLAKKYKLARLLGAGGMGAVYEATNTWTERRVALKLMLGDVAADSDLAARFLREARAASKIEHPNVVQILDMGQDDDGSLFIAQEYLSGTDLRHRLDEERVIGARETLELITPVMSALIVAHRAGITHRDLKPENIFLAKSTTGGTVPKLIDFGIAKVTQPGGDANRLTKTGAAMGTPYYMSPEQASGQKTIDAQTDVWAMGVVLYEMLTGQCPFEADNYNALMIAIVNTDVPKLETVSGNVPHALAEVVHRALVRDRTKRYRTMAQFLGALLECQGFDEHEWHRTLRNTHRTTAQEGGERVNAERDLDLVTTDRKTDRQVETAGAAIRKGGSFNEGPRWIDRVLGRSTIGQTPREIGVRGPSGTRRWPIRSVIGLGVAVVAIGIRAIVVRTTDSREDAARPVSMSVPQPVPSVATADTFLVQLTAHPSSAMITLDGEASGANTLVRQFHRDSTRHTVRVAATGYESTTVEFVDAAPASPIELVASRPQAPMRNGRAGQRAVRRQETATERAVEPTLAPTATQPATQPAPAPTPQPHRVVNGSPVLQE